MTQESAEFSNGEPRVRYTAVEVEEDGIPIFGGCHRRVGRSTVVLREQGYDNNNYYYSSLKFPTVKKYFLYLGIPTATASAASTSVFAPPTSSRSSPTTSVAASPARRPQQTPAPRRRTSSTGTRSSFCYFVSKISPLIEHVELLFEDEQHHVRSAIQSTLPSISEILSPDLL